MYFILALLIFAAALIVSIIQNNLWVHIPAIILYIKYPLAKHKEVKWQIDETKSSFLLKSSEHPNVIIILADDLGFNDISFYDKANSLRLVDTPNIDSLGKYGVSFTNAYSGHATCAPSRAALLTGKFPTKMGFEYTPFTKMGSWVAGKFMNHGSLFGRYHAENSHGLSYENMTLPMNEILISEMYQQAGYKTIQLGKW